MFLSVRVRIAVLLASALVLDACRPESRSGKKSDEPFFEDSLTADSSGLKAASSAASPAAPPAAFDPTAYRIRVVSLHSLDRRLSACGPQAACPDSLLRLAGLTSLLGVIFDERDADVLLFGETAPGAQALYSEDMVVALRNAWLAYARQQGNRITYLFPGISLDPAPANLQELLRLEKTFARQPNPGIQKNLEAWEETCKKPYQVTVTGLPPLSRFTKVLLQADYDLKGLADGAEILRIPGFPSIAELRKIRFQAGRVLGQAVPTMERYWLYPGNQEWEGEEGIVVFKRCPVVVLTADALEALRREEDSVRPDVNAIAGVFAHGFTQMYDRVAEARPLFKELENLFRMVAVAKLVGARFPEAEALSAFPALSRGYALTPVAVETKIPGRPARQQFDDSRSTAEGMEIDRHYLPSCGAVSIAVDPDNARMRRRKDVQLQAFKKRLAKGRLDAGSWYWDVRIDTGGYWDQFRDRRRMQELNLRFRNLAFFRVAEVPGAQGKGAAYELTDEDDYLLYRGDQRKALMDQVVERSQGRKAEAVFLELRGAASDRAVTFAADARALAAARNPNLSVITVAGRPGWLAPENPLFANSVELAAGEPAQQRLASGRFQGWIRLTFRFNTFVAGKDTTVAIHCLAKTPELAAKLEEEMDQAFRNKLFIAFSPLSALISVLAEFRSGLTSQERDGIRISEDEQGLFELG
jgi:hypothetical protein